MLPIPSVVACGAYERDNIGDLLFLVVSDYFAQGVVEADFSAPVAADMTELLHRHIPSTGELLSTSDYAGIWTVGGEVGATPREYVYRTAVTSQEWERFLTLDANTQDALLDEVMKARLESPYVPRPSAFARNRQARLVLNSVGVSGIAGIPPWRAAVAESALREASYISVRDQKSSDFLQQRDIPHRLAPDLIHTIAQVIPIDAPRLHTVLLQLSESHILKFGLSSWVSALADCKELADRPLRLFVAGSAPAHDSIKLYEQLISGLRSQRPDWDVALSDSRSIEDRVQEIATAALWIGSSLHGRIIASAYGTQRVSIEKPKVDTYARTWDPEFPLGIEPSTLSQAVTSALMIPHDAAHVAKLATEAERSVVDALRVLVGENDADAPDQLSIRVREAGKLQVAGMALERSLQQQTANAAELVKKNGELAKKNGELAKEDVARRKTLESKEADIRDLRSRVADIEASTSWRIGSRLVAVVVYIPRTLRAAVARRRTRR